MQLKLDNRAINQQRVKKLENVKLRIDEIKAKMNSLERELLEIKQLDKKLLYKPNIEKKKTIYKSDEILFFEELSYQRFPTLTRMSWQEAIESAKKSRVANYNDWRLPTIDELERLLTKQNIKNHKGESHHVLREFLNIMPQDSCFWSATEENELYAWVVDFGKGYDYWRNKSLKYYTLYVRKN